MSYSSVVPLFVIFSAVSLDVIVVDAASGSSRSVAMVIGGASWSSTVVGEKDATWKQVAQVERFAMKSSDSTSSSTYCRRGSSSSRCTLSLIRRHGFIDAGSSHQQWLQQRRIHMGWNDAIIAHLAHSCKSTDCKRPTADDDNNSMIEPMNYYEAV